MECLNKESESNKSKEGGSSIRIVYVTPTEKNVRTSHDRESTAKSSSESTSPNSPHSATMTFKLNDESHSSVLYTTQVPNDDAERVKSKCNNPLAKEPKSIKKVEFLESKLNKANMRPAPLLQLVNDTNTTRQQHNRIKAATTTTTTIKNREERKREKPMLPNNIKIKRKVTSENNPMIFDRIPASMPFFSIPEMRSSIERVSHRHPIYLVPHNNLNNRNNNTNYYYYHDRQRQLKSESSPQQKIIRGSSLTVLPTFSLSSYARRVPYAIASSAPTPPLSPEYNNNRSHKDNNAETPYKSPKQEKCSTNNVTNQFKLSLPSTSFKERESLSTLSELPSSRSYTSLLADVSTKEMSNTNNTNIQARDATVSTSIKLQPVGKVIVTASTQTSMSDLLSDNCEAYKSKRPSLKTLQHPAVFENAKPMQTMQHLTFPLSLELKHKVPERLDKVEQTLETLRPLELKESQTDMSNKMLLSSTEKERTNNENKCSVLDKNVHFTNNEHFNNSNKKNKKCTYSVQTQTYFDTPILTNDSKTNSKEVKKSCHDQRLQHSPRAHPPQNKEIAFCEQLGKRNRVEQPHPHLVKLINVKEVNKVLVLEKPEPDNIHFRYHETGLEVSPSRVDVLPALDFYETKNVPGHLCNTVEYTDNNQSAKSGLVNFVGHVNCSKDSSNVCGGATGEMRKNKIKSTISRKVQTDLFPYMEQLITHQPLTKRNIHDYLTLEQFMPHTSISNANNSKLSKVDHHIVNNLDQLESHLKNNTSRCKKVELICEEKKLILEQQEQQEQQESNAKKFIAKENNIKTLQLSAAALELPHLTPHGHSSLLSSTLSTSSSSSSSSSLLHAREQISPFPTPPEPPPATAISSSSFPRYHHMKTSPHGNDCNKISNKYDNNANITNTCFSNMMCNGNVKSLEENNDVLSTVKRNSNINKQNALSTSILSSSHEKWEHDVSMEPMEIKIATTTFTTTHKNTQYVPLNVPVDVKHMLIRQNGKELEKQVPKNQLMQLGLHHQRQSNEKEMLQTDLVQKRAEIPTLNYHIPTNNEQISEHNKISNICVSEQTNNSKMPHLLFTTDGNQWMRPTTHPVASSTCQPNYKFDNNEHVRELQLSETIQEETNTNSNDDANQSVFPNLINNTMEEEYERKESKRNNLTDEQRIETICNYNTDETYLLENSNKHLLQRHVQQMVVGKIAENTEYAPPKLMPTDIKEKIKLSQDDQIRM